MLKSVVPDEFMFFHLYESRSVDLLSYREQQITSHSISMRVKLISAVD